MAAKKQRRLDFERSQNIALLSLLTKNPASVGANTCPRQILNQEKGHTLSFSRECHLAEAVAFISGISDDPDHVVAICLEELAKGVGLRVLVAINRSTHANPTDERMLGRIKGGFDAVFRLLARTGTEKSSTDLEEQVTDAIIDLCRDRILTRIRSQRHAASSYKSKGRPSAGSNLETILSAICRHSFDKRNFPPSNVDSFKGHMEKLVVVLQKVENSKSGRVNVALKELLVTACALHRGRRAVDIKGILGDLSRAELNPGDSDWFRIWIRKLSRYRECAGYLFRTARKTTLLRNATVVSVSLGQEYFIRHQETANETCLTNCVSRCRNEAGTDTFKAKSRVTALKELGDGDFLPTLTKISKESRIHAEIQILAYYDLHPATIPPRVIKSNKDACYLCNLFIKSHGKFFTPRTHGRLYNGWRLPNVVALNDARRKMNGELQARIWERSLEYAETETVQNLISVNESNIGSLSSMSSLGSFGLLTEGVIIGKPTPVAGIANIAKVLSPKEPNPSLPGKSSKKGKEKERPVVDDNTGQYEVTQAVGLSFISPFLGNLPDSPTQTPTDKAQQEEAGPSSQSSSEAQQQSQDTLDEEPEDEPAPTPLTSVVPDPDPDTDLDSDLDSDLESSIPSETPENESRHRAQPKSNSPLDRELEGTLDPEEQDGLPPPVSTKPKPQIADSNLPLPPGAHIQQEQDFSKQDEDSQPLEIILSQGQPSSIILNGGNSGSPRKMPSYRNGKTGRITIHPEYIVTNTSTARSSRYGELVVEMRIIWLRPDQEQKEGPRHIPEFLADSLPTVEDLDTGSRDIVRLVDRHGEVVLVEVVRT